MDGMDAVLETVDIGGAETSSESTEVVETTTQTGGAETTQQDDPYSPKSSREFSQWLKGLKESNPENAKFVRMAKEAFSRGFALNQAEPRGLDGVRERYAMLDSVIHNDPERGELKGAEAISAIQDTLREYADIDERIAQGDGTALEVFDDAMKAGIVKMTPAILSMAQHTDPEGYAAAVLPHFVEQLKSSDLVKNYNGLVDVLNEKMPSWLPTDRQGAWQQDKMQRVLELAGGMGNWLNAQAQKVAGFKTQEPAGVKGQPTLSEREQQFNQREQDHHWTTNITPKMDEHAAQSFKALFAPFAKRLNLDPGTAKSLQMEFSRRVASQAAKDKPYMDQIKRYRGAKNPDAATVTNFAKVQFDKHAKNTMQALIDERYKSFLNGKPGPKPGTTQQNGNRGQAPLQGVQVVSVRPADGTFNPRNRTSEDIYRGIFRLNNGKTVRVVKQ